MNKFIEALQRILMPIASGMNKNRYVRAMRDGFVLSLPYTMVGSILTSLFSLPFLADIMSGTLLAQIKSFVAPTTIWSNSIISLFVVIGIAYSLAKEYKMNPLHSSMTSVVMFLITCPSFVADANGTVFNNALGFSYIGAKAIFSAIIMAIIGVEVFRWAINHKLTIKLPDSVPASIQDSFTSFIPAGIAMIVAIMIRQGFTFTTQGNLTDFIFYWVQAPLSGLALSYPSMLIYGIGINLFWFFGLHGQTMVGSVFTPFLTASGTENIEALAAGQALPNLINGGYSRAFIAFGFWISVPLLIALFLYTKKHKRTDWKEVMKISLIPGLFNIYEPLMFGLPLVLNPFALIPMLVTPIISHTVAYFLTVAKIIPYATGVALPITTPIGLAGILATNSIMAGVVQVLLMIPLSAMWYFFLSVQDKSERATGVYIEVDDENAA